MQGGESTRQTRGVGQELLQTDGLICLQTIGGGCPSGPLTDCVGAASGILDREHPGKMGMPGLGGSAHARNESFPSLLARLRPEGPDEDRALEGGISRQPLLDVVVAPEPHLEAVTV